MVVVILVSFTGPYLELLASDAEAESTGLELRAAAGSM